ncbi:hypothetical protein Phum_PHUM529300 [Pediculus humanus corporis]|uniref:Uncharacterized protein n=1 Tax=Pediculus humanus subsp. corporis TaxID=121224 RepID=E0VZ89_PEDHC|nr:uncharacterized protein Phum_PHUM529300 [Pediculus humanus corporis]EEB18695.1 hypothetical protein Phum_PHUM529300 [Pediculus humanus corporis]
MSYEKLQVNSKRKKYYDMKLVKILNVRMSLNLKMEVRTQRSKENWLNSTWVNGIDE